ncbi:nuclear RNA-splicing-associated protein-domain-containing protein [Radiomyces spectabilis]|uniref:nuclear RNA-splicing-associated protein-domain-containing protein n=1 Tax=Radiomyces spectabilis TaxID=64574 RepID=UPI00221EB472|nr:nuclear RNA-splicing-associated protein-domain-containing protein [Radiomyces spectabilis]KAI8388714.1 nuclear RNA-splicing-associated protein-domain-containing protein [Radiomyces spectabilis]
MGSHSHSHSKHKSKKRRHSDDSHKERHSRKRKHSRSPSVEHPSKRSHPHHKASEEKNANDDAIAQLRKLAQAQKTKEQPKEKKVISTPETSHHGRRQVMVPMTKESYEKERSIIRRELDPDTGRMRLVRATGEILESVVTRDQHRAINKTATLSDGINFQARLSQQMHHIS